jgi:hypothetical protein
LGKQCRNHLLAVELGRRRLHRLQPGKHRQ